MLVIQVREDGYVRSIRSTGSMFARALLFRAWCLLAAAILPIARQR
jgi:hypothetical protein